MLEHEEKRTECMIIICSGNWQYWVNCIPTFHLFNMHSLLLSTFKSHAEFPKVLSFDFFAINFFLNSADIYFSSPFQRESSVRFHRDAEIYWASSDADNRSGAHITITKTPLTQLLLGFIKGAREKEKKNQTMFTRHCETRFTAKYLFRYLLSPLARCLK